MLIFSQPNIEPEPEPVPEPVPEEAPVPEQTKATSSSGGRKRPGKYQCIS